MNAPKPQQLYSFLIHTMSIHIPSASSKNCIQLRALGFCGVDDSVLDPEMLALISSKYPFVEWGVLFRPDLEGTPRYASSAWLKRLAIVKQKSGASMRLAGHLCGAHVDGVLQGDSSFVKSLATFGFGRVQINATAVNGVNTQDLSLCVDNLLGAIRAVPEVEWIIQRNLETQPLWEPLYAREDIPSNISFLFDSSCGKGILPSSFPEPTAAHIPCGYAGGIGPENIFNVLGGLSKVLGSQREVWIDMESSLRSDVDNFNSFSIQKCFRCILETTRFQRLEYDGQA